MSNYSIIHIKLHKFIKRFYTNELIKGILLFLAIGLLYFIVTLLIEYFLWLKPVFRTVLFWLFILVEVSLLVRYILIPIFKIYGLKTGISEIDASKIIGKHFPEVSDKLLNMLQLKESQQGSELIEASIEQKSKELKPIPFKKAINFSANKKYIKYVAVPIVIWLLVYISGNGIIFNDSFSRVVHYKTAYEAPVPFSFKILNDSLNVLEGESFTLQIETIGNTIPEDVKINFLNENYYLEHTSVGKFEYNFTNITNPIIFFIEANGIVSKEYQLYSIATPVITNLKMVLKYPSYTGKKNEVIQNTGNAIVPQGTEITWQVETHQTENISFVLTNTIVDNFKRNATNYYSYSKKLVETTNYTITTSNTYLKNHETLNFGVEVIADQFPKISVKSNIDSVSSGPVQFIGQVSDDYGVSKLQLVYYNKSNKKLRKTHVVNVLNSNFKSFFYIFPEGLEIEDGINYEFYFEVFDNDVVNGSKSTKSTIFSYYKKTEVELDEALLKDQKETINTISKSLKKAKQSNLEVEKFKNLIQKKADFNWSDTKKLEQFIMRQSQYEELFKRQTTELKENLYEQPFIKSLEEKKEDLKKRIEELKQLEKQEKMLDELKELTEKLEMDDLVEKLNELVNKNKQKEQSLERILELTKRFYVEQKANQITEKLEKLADKESELSMDSGEENNAKNQQLVNNEFDEIKRELKVLEKENSELLHPMKFPKNEDKKEEINKDLNDAVNELNNGNTDNSSSKFKAQKSQKSASKKLKQLGKSLEQSMMASEAESIDENIEELRKIVENLIEFSFQQEELMDSFSNGDNHNPEYPKNLKKQYILKEYFEHIDDSIYMLSLRLVKMSSAIQKDVNEAHYYIDESLNNFSENNFELGKSDQQFVITAANNLANMLSGILESLMNASPSMGKGKGKSNGFTLPDIIKKQGELSRRMKDGLKKSTLGNDKGEAKSNGAGEELSDELYEIYKGQFELRQIIQNMIRPDGSDSNLKEDVVKNMETLEQEMLEKGFSKEIVEQMNAMNYELLKFERATKERGEDNQRKSNEAKKYFEARNIKTLELDNQYFNNNEILNRQSLPLRTIYKKKVQEYFKTVQ